MTILNNLSILYFIKYLLEGDCLFIVFGGFAGIVGILNLFFFKYLLEAYYFANSKKSIRCLQWIQDKTSLQMRQCKNFAYQNSAELFCFVHAKKTSVLVSSKKICDALIINQATRGIIEFCSKSVENKSQFCVFHKNYLNSNLFWTFSRATFTINLHRLLFLKEIFYHLSLKKGMFKDHAKLYNNIFKFLTQCLNQTDRLNFNNFEYFETVLWRFFYLPIGCLDPQSISLLELPIFIIRLLFEKGSIIFLDNFILKSIFNHFKKKHPDQLFWKSYPIIYELISNKFGIYLKMFFRNLDIKDQEKFQKIFPFSVVNGIFNVSWNDFVKYLLFHDLRELNFVEKISNDFFNLWTILKMLYKELADLKEFFWQNRVTITYKVYFEKFRASKKFRFKKSSNYLKASFFLLLVDDFFNDIFSLLNIYYNFPSWLTYLKSGYILVTKNVDINIIDLNNYFSNFFKLNKDSSLFHFQVLIFDNLTLGSFIINSFELISPNLIDFCPSTCYYFLDYRLRENWQKFKVISGNSLPLEDFKIAIMRNWISNNFKTLNRFYSNNLNKQLSLFQNSLSDILIKKKEFGLLSLKKKKIFLNKWKTLTKNSLVNRSLISNKFLKQMTFKLFFFFKNEFESFLKKRLNKKSFFGYLKTFLQIALKVLSKKFPVISEILNNLSLDESVQNFFNSLINEDISWKQYLKILFFDLQSSTSFDNNQWITMQPILQKSLYKTLAVFFVKKFVVFIFSDSKLLKDLKSVKLWIADNFNDDLFLESNFLNKVYLKLVSKFILCLVHSKIIRDKGTNFLKANSKYKIRLWLINYQWDGVKIGLNNFFLPYIEQTPPTLSNKNNSLIKPPINGKVTSTQLSDQAILTINRLQQSKFVINIVYLKLLQKLDKKGKNLPWPTNADYRFYLEKLKKFANEIPHLHWKIKIWLSFKKKNLLNQINRNKLILLLRLSGIELELIRKFEKILNHFKELKKKRIFFLKVIWLLNQLQKYKLSFAFYMDYRLRIYSFFWGFGPNSVSYLKRILNTSQKLKLGFESFYLILRTYYSIDVCLLKKVDNFFFNLKSKNLSKTQLVASLIKFFYCNYLITKFSDLKILLLHKEIEIIILSKKFSSNMLLTIDQKTSNLCLFAILFRDHLLARKCNLIAKKSQDIFQFIQDKFSVWLKLKKGPLTTEYKKILIFFKKYRFFLKEASMKFLYSQQWKARLDNWIEQFKKLLNITFIENDLYLALKFISINYKSFLGSIFPNLVHNITVLKKIIRLSIQLTHQVEFHSIDGSSVVYKLFHVNQNVVKIWDNRRQKYVSTRIKSLSNKLSNSVLNRYLRAFFPNVLHNLDSSILRQVVSEWLSENPNEKIDFFTQHDSFSVPVNQLPFLYEKLHSFYKSSSNKNIIEAMILTPIFNKLKNDSDKKKIENLASKFIFGKKWSGRYFKIENIYPPELK